MPVTVWRCRLSRGRRTAARYWALVLIPGAVAVQAQPGVPDDLVDAPGVDVVRRHCTVCHSAALVTQSRASREGWMSMIRWMQDKQGLWPLGGDEAPILDYLAANYSPQFSGRRAPLAADLLPPPFR